MSTTQMAAAFDRAAPSYDDLFERNAVTARLRSLIWRSLLTWFRPGDNVLDLSCGTGTDAIYLALKNIRVTAIDISPAMIRIASEKACRLGVEEQIRFFAMPMEKIADTFHEPFAGVYSNFGGLNCLSDLPGFVSTVASALRPGGTFVACLLNRISLWEIASFLLHGQPKQALRRRSGEGVLARVGGELVQIQYCTPQQMTSLLTPWFDIIDLYALNIFSPPPGSIQFQQQHPHMTASLLRVDDLFRRMGPARGWGDHFVIAARRREK
jgi:ubiquinone/menaquinone biosynthesis C-methylase UbiE